MSQTTPTNWPTPEEMVYRYSSYQVIGEVTESIHRHLLERYDLGENPPRLEEDLKFVPKDREEVVYVYMYRAAANTSMQRQKRFREAPVTYEGQVFYHRPPLLMDLFYVICVHAKFRSEAERLLGWILLTLHDTARLLYRPRRFILPDGRAIDSTGRDWDPTNFDPEGKQLQVEKVSLALVDDMSLGDAVNLFTLHEATYRPFLTYRARVALDGPLIPAEGGTQISLGKPGDLGMVPTPPETGGPTTRKSGRISGSSPAPPSRSPPGPPAHNMSKGSDHEPESDS